MSTLAPDSVRPETPLERLLGGRTASTLAKELNLTTAEELLRHFPRRYVAYGQLSAFVDLNEGEQVTFMAEVVSCNKREMLRRRGFIVDVEVKDEQGGRLRMAFFYGHEAFRRLRPGTVALFAGKVTTYAGQLTLNNPDFEVVVKSDGVTIPHGAGEGKDRLEVPVPLYPATAGVSSWKIKSCIEIVLNQTDFSLWPQMIPPVVARAENLPGLGEAYELVHRPQEDGAQKRGWRHFRFAEALIVQGLMDRRRRQLAASPALPAAPKPDGVLQAFDDQLPFDLTAGQRRCGEILAADLGQPKPMNRLLQGEVGSGKTLVALRAMLQVVDAGAQAALVAPTEVLAMQHERSLRRSLGALAAEFPGDDGVHITLLTGSMSASARKQALLDIASGQAGIVVGTHALLGEKVQFAQLGLAVIDEQHRFGVEQRNALRSRFTPTPHTLVMSATPIPRSVAMTVFGDLELTVLEGLPGGRSPIATHVVPMMRGREWIQRVWARIAEEARAGHQCYVVCPKISAEEEGASVELMLQKLREIPVLSQLRLAGAHGQLPAAELAATMNAFERGDLDVLVSTTVIEVGVDVPNATLMVILDADSFGISTLHQLRGRIGRGHTQKNQCLLVTRLPEEHPSVERLREVAATTDGMALATLDLARRREGDILSSLQSGGRSTLRLLRAARDEELIVQAGEWVARLSNEDPDWHSLPELRDAVETFQARHDDAEDYIDRG